MDQLNEPFSTKVSTEDRNSLFILVGYYGGVTPLLDNNWKQMIKPNNE